MRRKTQEYLLQELFQEVIFFNYYTENFDNSFIRISTIHTTETFIPYQILGQAQRFGVREHDKILTINGKTPRNVDDAVGVIKQVTSID